jgi:uncharacterized protein
MEQNLHERLRRLGLTRGTGQIRQRSRRKAKPIEELIAGELVDTENGRFFLYQESYTVDHLHGQQRLSALLAHLPRGPALLARDERLAGVDLARIAFVDTETTGLAGGTGTYAFLVGVGVFRGGGFVLHQFFMRDYGEEPAQLQALGELLDGMEAVVSFNGKSFDVPLLESRFIMARQRPRLIDVPHLDLLPAARRLWKYRLASCALSSLEEEVLAVRRTQADVPGWLIPDLYADYARSGDAREMPRIFYHNAQDILSLVTLAARMCDLLASGDPLSGDLPGEDLYGLGRMFDDLGEAERAEHAYARAAQSAQAQWVRERAMHDLAYLLKRQERRAEALPWWQALARTEGAVYAYEELAKHYEWQAGDPAQALAWTREAADLVQQWPRGAKRRATLAELEHRMARLERKVAGQAGTDPAAEDG